MFLTKFRPDGPVILCCIPANGGTLVAERFDSYEEVEAWVTEHNPGCGIYYQVAIPKEGLSKKLTKEEVLGVKHLWVDIDDGEDILKRLMAPAEGVPGRPTAVVSSGGGFQGLWELSEVCHDIETIERATRHLAAVYGGDRQAWNADRLLRLPDTINYPNEAKRKKGRTAKKATYKWLGGTYDIKEFTLAPPPKPKGEAGDITINGRKKEYNEENLPEMDEKWKDLIIHCENSWHYEDCGYPSRSEVVMGAALYLVERDVDPQVIFDILLSRDLKISDHIYDQEFVERYAKRQITQAMKMKNAPEPSLATDDKGKPIKTLENVVQAAKLLGNDYKYNELSDIMLVDDKPYEDHIATRIRLEAEKKWQFGIAQAAMTDVVKMLCRENPFHPVREYLSRLPKWDGESRVDEWLVKYCGAEDTEFNRAVGRIILVAAVRRIMKPGCKFDEMLILEGRQGDGKSELLGKGLVPNSEWFNDHLTLDRSPKDFVEDTLGHWIIECSELVTMRRAQVEGLKAMLSRQVDKARLAYARSRSDRPRQFIIIGSTNQECYLVDDTGNRRFWPVKTSGKLHKRVDELARNRDQLWAEAVALEKAGEPIRLDPKLYEVAADLQRARLVENTYTESVGRAVGNCDGWLRMSDLLKHLAIPLGDSKISKLVSSALREHGFLPRQMKMDGRSARVWARGEGKLEAITFLYEDEVSVQ